MPGRRLRIAHVAPPFYEVPPDGYGGIEAVVALLVDGLVERGHDVTLIGAGQRHTMGDFRATYESAQTDRLGDQMVELTHAARVDALLDEVSPDVIHDHSAAGGAMAKGRAIPVVMTSHGPATGAWGEYLGAVAVTLVAISDSQRRLSPQLPWHSVVYNALDTSTVPLRTDKGDHLVWLGRMSPDKAAHVAIDVAREAGRPLVLAAKCSESEEQAYFDEFVAPRLGADIDWRGEVGPDEKYDILGAAAGFLFPLQWDEPFGMVMIEAMATGTPVLTLDRGAAPEIVADGVTGFVRSRPEELVEAIGQLSRISPQACRAHVEELFSPQRLVDGYERIYRELVSS